MEVNGQAPPHPTPTPKLVAVRADSNQFQSSYCHHTSSFPLALSLIHSLLAATALTRRDTKAALKAFTVSRRIQGSNHSYHTVVQAAWVEGLLAQASSRQTLPELRLPRPAGVCNLAGLLSPAEGRAGTRAYVQNSFSRAPRQPTRAFRRSKDGDRVREGGRGAAALPWPGRSGGRFP